MDEESLHDTAPKATKTLFGSLAFILIMVGIELMIEKEPRYFFGAILFLMGVACSYAAVAWAFVRTKLPESARTEIATIATSPRWWIGAIFATLALAIFSPFIEQQQWPATWQLSAFIGGCLLLVIGSIIGSALSSKRIPHNQKRSVMITELPLPVVLSDEEKQFRFGLRTFVLSSLKEQNTAFTQFASRLANPDSNTVFVKDPETTRAAGILLDALLRVTYHANWNALRKRRHNHRGN